MGRLEGTVSLLAKAVQLAPVILTTGATLALLVIKVDDPKTKKVIQVIAILLAVGTAFSIVIQIPTVLAAVEDGVKSATRLLGLARIMHHA